MGNRVSTVWAQSGKRNDRELYSTGITGLNTPGEGSEVKVQREEFYGDWRERPQPALLRQRYRWEHAEKSRSQASGAVGVGARPGADMDRSLGEGCRVFVTSLLGDLIKPLVEALGPRESAGPAVWGEPAMDPEANTHRESKRTEWHLLALPRLCLPSPAVVWPPPTPAQILFSATVNLDASRGGGSRKQVSCQATWPSTNHQGGEIGPLAETGHPGRSGEGWDSKGAVEGWVQGHGGGLCLCTAQMHLAKALVGAAPLTPAGSCCCYLEEGAPPQRAGGGQGRGAEMHRSQLPAGGRAPSQSTSCCGR